MNVFIGTNYGHGSAASVIGADGTLLYAVEEGRLVGQKRYSGFPDLALARIADQYGGSVAGWSEGWNARQRLFYKGAISTLRFGWRDRSYLNERLVREWRRYFTGLRGFRRWSKELGPVNHVGHHDAHALSLLPWGLPPDSLIVVSDYIGERWSMSCFHWDGRRLLAISRVPFPHSLGAAYHQLATHLGFLGDTGPGTLMALSAYGEPRWAEYVDGLVRWRAESFRIDQRQFPVWKRRQAWTELGRHASEPLEREIGAAKDRWESGRDLAASVQEWFAEATWRYVSACLRKSRSMSLNVRALGLAGGAALNCQANGTFMERLHGVDLDQLIVSPWSDDSGTAIGAAVHAARAAHRDIEFAHATPFLGPPATDGQSEPTADAIAAAIHALSTGGVIALVTGKLEFGPRALGGRCLLADPRAQTIRARLNAMKGRRPFMPFAPAVLEEHYAEYFEGRGSTNMAWTTRIRPEIRERHPGMDHPSGQARVQIVDAGAPALLRRLLSEWLRTSRCAVLLLTSLNGAGEEIPDTLARSRKIAATLNVDGVLADDGWLPRS